MARARTRRTTVVCVGDCASCAACVRRLPVELVRLMAVTRGVEPVVYDTAVHCSRVWLRAHPVAKVA